ncbi:DUF6545 domain-containing protein [Streptomyces sp. NPDC007901]|uniref:DUF6545 domain-containing protein n=1 Tax=Streptomyces sp. NPDC007901 TaxID=3364785 RepID=UPI0036E24127
MRETVLTVINLSIAIATIILGITKASAARREPGPTLKLTASVLLHSGVIFLLATPPLYRRIGTALRSPNLPALGIDIATLLCVAHAHYMTLLWHPERHTPEARHEAVRRWRPFYLGTIITMIVLYAIADLPGAAPPLHLAPYYAHVKAVLALKLVYFTALVVAVAATMILCRQVALPDRPELAHDVRRCIQWFTLAVGLDLATALFTLGSMGSAIILDNHRLDVLADASWAATILSGIAANNSLGRMVLATTRSDRQDCRTLRPLWKLVVTDAPQLVIPVVWWGDSRIRLDRMMMETLDGIRTLSPWMSTAPGNALTVLAHPAANRRTDPGEQPPAPPHTRSSEPPAPAQGALDSAAGSSGPGPAETAAAILIVAARHRAMNRPPVLEGDRLSEPPGREVPADEQQDYLVKVARYLSHPLVVAAASRAEGDDQAAAVNAAR